MASEELQGVTTAAATAAEVLKRRAESLASETTGEEIGDLVGILLFCLSDECYAIRVEDVSEIYQGCIITKIPCAPDFVLGVMNIRGEIISAVDAARLMNLGQLTVDVEKATAIIIQNEECSTALLVDEIGDIADVSGDSIEPPLSAGDTSQVEFMSGSLYFENRLISLVNIDRILEPIGVEPK